jgi:DNA-binding MurR/RpiR family transcriptional regulator
MLIRTRIEEIFDELTVTERKLCTALLLDYPFAGLEPIQTFAELTKTSPPTISRFVAKLGFQGFQDFQRHLIGELKEGGRSPLDLHKTSEPLSGAFLESFITRAKMLMDGSTRAISEAQFDRTCELLSDKRRKIFIIGGRMSDALGVYLSRHMRLLRDKVFHLPPDPEAWPDYLLRMRPKDILFVIDFRRYQPNLQALAARSVRMRNAHVVLMTDKWLSPISQQASEVLAVPIDSGTPWDSYTGALALMEAIVTRIAETGWEQSEKRIQEWDSMRLDFGDPEDDC